MRRANLLLRIAGALTLFTFLGHTAGTFMPVPPEQAEVARTTAVMKATLVPMPIGRAQSFSDLFRGNNLAVSLYLLVAGLSFFFFSGKDGLAGGGRRHLLLHSAGMAALALISAVYFFPLPAVCTGIAALLGFIAAKKA